MTTGGRILTAMVLSAACVGLPAASFADATAPAAHDCFFVNQWQGWKSPSPDVIYLRVNLHDVYRVDLSAGSSTLRYPNVHLINEVRGSNSICSALDLQLYVADTIGFREPLIARDLVKLTPEQVAAIPPEFRP